MMQLDEWQEELQIKTLTVVKAYEDLYSHVDRLRKLSIPKQRMYETAEFMEGTLVGMNIIISELNTLQ